MLYKKIDTGNASVKADQTIVLCLTHKSENTMVSDCKTDVNVIIYDKILDINFQKGTNADKLQVSALTKSVSV